LHLILEEKIASNPFHYETHQHNVTSDRQREGRWRRSISESISETDETHKNWCVSSRKHSRALIRARATSRDISCHRLPTRCQLATTTRGPRRSDSVGERPRLSPRPLTGDPVRAVFTEHDNRTLRRRFDAI